MINYASTPLRYPASDHPILTTNAKTVIMGYEAIQNDRTVFRRVGILQINLLIANFHA